MKRTLFIGLIAGTLSAGATAEVVTFTGIPHDVSPTSMTTYVENGVTVTSLEGSFWAYPNPGELHFDPEGSATRPSISPTQAAPSTSSASTSRSRSLTSLRSWKASTRMAPC